MKIDLKLAQDQLLKLFEQSLFVLADPLDLNDGLSPQGEYLKTQMVFSGDIKGEFILYFPEEKCKEVMSNFLGIDIDAPEIAEMSNLDAASEIMNILGAHILSVCLNDSGKFSIGLPETKTIRPDDSDFSLQDDQTTGILIDGLPILFKAICS